MLSSEVGVVDNFVADAEILSKHRLEPGKMFYADFNQGRIVSDAEIKAHVIASRPFQKWVDEGLVALQNLPVSSPAVARSSADICRRLNMFGYVVLYK
jgi:glutamate synthase (NADPH/NADH) large chain